MKQTISPHTPLTPAFFAGDACTVARGLLGQVLEHTTSAGVARGIIVETEAYDATDPASHSARGRTPRNGVMFGPGGYAYVYRSYGIHWCMNVSCGPEGVGAAVLLRALEPIAGFELMAERRGLPTTPQPLLRLARGPGCLTAALGITGAHDGTALLDPAGQLRLLPGAAPPTEHIVATPRIGITRATDWPWRFVWAHNRYVSGPRRNA